MIEKQQQKARKTTVMSDELNEISNAIGRLQADVKHILHQVDGVDRKVESLQASNVENGLSVKNAHRRLDELTPKVDHHESLKNKGLGVIAAVGVIFGVLGALLGKIFHL